MRLLTCVLTILLMFGLLFSSALFFDIGTNAMKQKKLIKAYCFFIIIGFLLCIAFAAFIYGIVTVFPFTKEMALLLDSTVSTMINLEV